MSQMHRQPKPGTHQLSNLGLQLRTTAQPSHVPGHERFQRRLSSWPVTALACLGDRQAGLSSLCRWRVLELPAHTPTHLPSFQQPQYYNDSVITKQPDGLFEGFSLFGLCFGSCSTGDWTQGLTHQQALCYRATAPCLELNVPRREDKHKLPCLLSTMLGCSRKSADSHVEESPQEDPPVVTARAVGGEFMLLGQTF